MEEGQDFEPEPKEPRPEPLSKPTEEELFRVSDPSGGCKVVSGGSKSIDLTCSYTAACGDVVRVYIEPFCVAGVHGGT